MDVALEKYVNNKINRPMKEPQELFILTIHHPLKAFLVKKILFQFTKYYFQVFWIMYSLKIPQTYVHFKIDKNFIPEILKQLDIELKLYHKWYIKFGARFLKLPKWVHL